MCPRLKKGPCQRGTLQCLGGQEICVGAVGPRLNATGNCEELADGNDNDCDGNVDENPGSCTSMNREICNGRDDDCDGSVDEDGCADQMACGEGDTTCTDALTFRRDETLDRGPSFVRPPSERRICLAPAAPQLPEGTDVPITGGLGVGEITEVILAGGYWKNGQRTIGMVWHELGERDNAAIGFRTLTFEHPCVSCEGSDDTCSECAYDRLQFDELGELLDVGEPINVSGVGFRRDPSVVFVESGVMTQDNPVRDETDESTGNAPDAPAVGGGWYVVWVDSEERTFEPATVVARPIAAQTGEPLFGCPSSGPCGYNLAADPDMPFNGSFPRAFVINDEPRFAYPGSDTRGQFVVTGKLGCAVTNMETEME